eukprot:g30774.t1
MKRCGHPVGRMFVAEIAADLQVHHHRFTVRMESEIQNASQPLINKEPFHHWEKNWTLGSAGCVKREVVVSMDHQFIAGQQVYNTSSPQVIGPGPTLKDGQYLVYHNFFYLFDASPPFAVRHVLRKEVPLLPGPSAARPATSGLRTGRRGQRRVTLLSRGRLQLPSRTMWMPT